MENKEIAKQVGERLRRIRQAKGLSQQQLADMMFTTPQNISKYEKNGISDIDTIRQLSDKIGQDLLVDEKDVEGPVGEVGKEILWLLLESGGHKPVDKMISEDMHGMSKERFSKEVFKLERIGLCVREQYINYDDSECDRLFITAKGLITYKNIVGHDVFTSNELDIVQAAKTYEEFIGDKVNYQEVIDERPFEKLIMRISPQPGLGYQMNYIMYLKNNFEEGMYFDIDKSNYASISSVVPARNFYFDLIYMMALELDKDFYRTLIADIWDEDYELYELEKAVNEVRDGGPLVRNSRKMFEELFPAISNYVAEEVDPFELPEVKSSQYVQAILEDYQVNRACNYYNWRKLEDPVTCFNENLMSHTDHPYPTEWFSDEEIRNFIMGNLTVEGFCKNEWYDAEKELGTCENINQKIREINRLNPKTLEYFQFPKQWEENGLAQLVREIYGIQDISFHETNT